MVIAIVILNLAPYRLDFYEELARSLNGIAKLVVVTRSLTPQDHPWTGLSGKERLFSLLCVPRRLMKILDEINPQVLWTGEYSSYTLTAALYGKLRQRKVILGTELGDHPPSYASSRAKSRMHHALDHCFDGVVAHTSDAFLSRRSERLPTLLAPHAVRIDQYYPSEVNRTGPVRFLSVGALSQRKGVPLMLEASRLLREKTGPGVFKVVVAGTGPLRNELESAARKEDWLELAGFVQDGALVELYRRADAFLMPTREDTYGVVVHEAAASGLPLLVSTGAGAAEVLVREGVTGWALPWDDPNPWVDRMEQLCRDPGLRNRLGIAARKRAELSDVRLLGRQTAAWLLSFLPAGQSPAARELMKSLPADSNRHLLD